MGYLKKRRFGTLYTRGWSRSRLVVPLWIIVDSTLISCLSWRALPPSIESSNSLSEILPPPISCHASSFSESVPSVSQSRFAIKGGRTHFRLGRSRHSRNSPVHRLITRVRIQSAHSEWKKRSSWILFLKKNVYQLIPIHSVKVSMAFSRSSEVHHVDTNATTVAGGNSLIGRA